MFFLKYRNIGVIYEKTLTDRADAQKGLIMKKAAMFILLVVAMAMFPVLNADAIEKVVVLVGFVEPTTIDENDFVASDFKEILMPYTMNVGVPEQTWVLDWRYTPERSAAVEEYWSQRAKDIVRCFGSKEGDTDYWGSCMVMDYDNNKRVNVKDLRHFQSILLDRCFGSTVEANPSCSLVDIIKNGIIDNSDRRALEKRNKSPETTDEFNVPAFSEQRMDIRGNGRVNGLVHR